MGDRKRRIRILLAALAALIVLIVAAAVLFRPPKPIPPLSRSQYRALADRAVELFQTDPAAAMEQLRDLQQRPAEGDPKLAKILQEAFEADAAAVKNLEKGYETAQAKWEEVRKSSESTEAAVNLARERYDWFQSQVIELIYLGAARDAIKQGDYLKALNNAASLDKAGRYGKEAEALIQQATDAITKAVTADAAQMHWTDAAKQLRDLIKARPDLAESLQPKVAEYEQNEAQRVNVEEATAARPGGQIHRGRAVTRKGRRDRPVRAAGRGAPGAGPPERAWSRTRKRRTTAAWASRPWTCSQKWAWATRRPSPACAPSSRPKPEPTTRSRPDASPRPKPRAEEILRLEPVQTNAYAQEAKRNLDNMPAAMKAGAHKLVDQADLAFQDHEYQTARNDYEEALKLDPASKEAKDGLARLSKSALFDFNIAIALPRDTLEQVNDVLQKLQAVRDRILTEDPLYLQVDREITAAQRTKASLEKQGGQKGP